ncbi:MAG: hypothetical protein PVS3B1_35990 [Ktedonobacteraceae bacterium]
MQVMNISTGGPHILLFERDQQLATLLVSELQLAGYTNHTARTAVEVFDAIARHPVRLVLVNLAQAAAARREFWVALDSQRRDRKVQVLTFLCTNLAGYGPRDFEDRSSSTIADIEVDGMMGLMSLVEAVRARVPSDRVEMAANTLPRLPKVSPTPLPHSTTPYTPNQRAQQQQAASTAPTGTNSAAYRSTTLADTNAQQASTRGAYMTQPAAPAYSSTGQTQPTSAPSNTNSYTQQQPAPSNTGPNSTGYTEKIRAVLYPNQRTWSSQSSQPPNTYPIQQENKEATTQQAYSQRYNAPTPGPSDSALQRLASGQLGEGEGTNESGLAQLSRMAQGYRSFLSDESDSSTISTATESPAPATNTRSGMASTLYQTGEPTQPFTARPTPAEQHSATHPQTETNGHNNTSQAYAIPGGRHASEETSTQTNISMQTLRASPIQDVPIERTVTGPAITENARRPDVLSRANYGQQLAQIAQQLQEMQQAQPTSPPLASIATSMPPTTPTTPIPTNRTPPATPATPVTSPTPLQEEIQQEEIAQRVREEALQRVREEIAQRTREEARREQENRGGGIKEKQSHSQIKQEQADLRSEAGFEDGLTANNAVLLDIVQSLPPMPALSEQPQSVQPQVLSGRATRSLGKVLLDGHLVPHDRLEVAQNIQRMLRGVDLNYQLGEILLMFKLLTPDQLLAASLVSYGLITTTQISALGRIRQELHSIGLEYDLENLLILFRILTPEQLREVRASLQS